VGACSQAPVVVVDEEIHGQVCAPINFHRVLEKGTKLIMREISLHLLDIAENSVAAQSRQGIALRCMKICKVIC
jgi:hypothetical protein